MCGAIWRVAERSWLSRRCTCEHPSIGAELSLFSHISHTVLFVVFVRSGVTHVARALSPSHALASSCDGHLSLWDVAANHCLCMLPTSSLFSVRHRGLTWFASGECDAMHCELRFFLRRSIAHAPTLLPPFASDAERCLRAAVVRRLGCATVHRVPRASAGGHCDRGVRQDDDELMSGACGVLCPVVVFM